MEHGTISAIALVSITLTHTVPCVYHNIVAMTGTSKNRKRLHGLGTHMDLEMTKSFLQASITFSH